MRIDIKINFIKYKIDLLYTNIPTYQPTTIDVIPIILRENTAIYEYEYEYRHFIYSRR